MDGMGCERSELQRFCCKNMSLRKYGSFNSLVALCHLEFLVSAEKQTTLFILQVTESSCICIMSPTEAPSNNFILKTGETQLKMVIFGIYSNFECLHITFL